MTQLILLNTLKAQTTEERSNDEMGVNLVANGSFEELNTCIEFGVDCSPEAWFDLPINWFDQATKCRIKAINGNFHEYLTIGSKLTKDSKPFLYTKFLCSLEKNKIYIFSLWVNAFVNSFDHLDVSVTKLEPNKEKGWIEKLIPSFVLNKSSITDSSEGWKKVEYTYKANGDEKFFTIGYFSGKIDKTKNKPIANNRNILYAIDNVRMQPLDSGKISCFEYYAIKKQLYNQNYRHSPNHFLSDIAIDSSLIKPFYLSNVSPKKEEITWVIVDTPPSMKGKIADTLIIPDILFRFNSSEINQLFKQKLDSIIDLVKEKNYRKITIIGHTDNIGSVKHNEQLSLQRATTIKRYIVEKLLIDEKIIETSGAGEREPIASNNTSTGRQKNRRVEIVLKR